jgi:hypothetical protein
VIAESVLNKKQLQSYDQFENYRILQSVEPDAADRLLCKSADSGHPGARYSLGQIFEYSKNNYIQAYVWYSLSHTYDKERLQSFVDNHLSQEEHDDAKLALQEWHPGQCERDLGLSENHQ